MKRMFSGILAAAVIAGVSSFANAEVVFNLENYKTGTQPDGTSPWVVATFETIAVGQVKLTIDATNLASDNFFEKFWFNVDGKTITSAIESPDNPNVNYEGLVTGPGSPIGSAPSFDYALDFPQSNSNRFRGGQIVSFILSGTGLVEGDFVDPVTSDKADYNFAEMNVAAHIQGISTGEGSTVIWDGGDDGGGDIPEPASLGVLGLGAAALLTRRRK